jgi:Tfp pilus assembly protein PilX
MAMHRGARRRQNGVVLFIALIALVAMSLAGIAMMRSTDTTLGIAGNFAFKQSTVQASEQATSAAANWLQSVNTTTTLQQNFASQGYTAYMTGSDPNWFDQSVWNLPNTPDSQPSRSVTWGTDAAGNTVRLRQRAVCHLSSFFGWGIGRQHGRRKRDLSGDLAGLLPHYHSR